MAIKSKEYSDYAKPELDDKLRQLEEELFNLKFQSKTTKLDKSHKIKLTRRDIARVKTFLRKLELKEKSKAKVINK
ncbi:MAG: 50S ribosomal protein L29 [Candidatus Omnitrophica bacterium]|nr:50S ribosomal protein L29 [Candidatus Omnitrophota bacterium]